jgi:hypothetical protein
MAIYLGSTNIATIYLGEAGYGLPNITEIYLGSTLVWSAT